MTRQCCQFFPQFSACGIGGVVDVDVTGHSCTYFPLVIIIDVVSVDGNNRCRSACVCGDRGI